MKKTSFILFPLFLILYELTVNMSNDMYVPGLTKVMADLQTNLTLIEFSITIWFAGTMIMNPVLGALSDNYGRKKILLISGFVFLVATFYCVVSHNIYLFNTARFFQGLTVTSIVVGGYALIHEIYDDKQAILLLSWMTSALIVAPMIGPILGGIIITYFGWRTVFMLLFLLSAVSLICLSFFMPHPKPHTQLANENLVDTLKVYKKLFSNRNFMLGSLTAGLLFGCLIAWITGSPILILADYHYSPISFGLLQIPIFGGYIIGTQLLRLCLRFSSEEKIIGLGLSIVLTASLLMAISIISKLISLPLLIVFLSFYSAGFGLTFSPLNRLIVTSLPFGMGKKIAIFDFIFGLMGTLGAVLINIQAQTENLLNYLTMIITLFAFLACIIYFINFILQHKIRHKKVEQI